MRQFLFAFVALLVSIPADAGARLLDRHDARPEQSAALFVGVRGFEDASLTKVPYAIDDAVDLAYEVSMVLQPPLVPPRRVVLALSPGQPHKADSRLKLKALLAAGAVRRPARRTDLLAILDRQCRNVGRDGMLIVTFATHGVSPDGIQNLLAVDSRIALPATMIPDNVISDVISRCKVPRSLILIDACREHLAIDRRNSQPDERSVAVFIRIMTGVEGQAILSGAARGGYAYDDDAMCNGVFTAAVLEGLRCGAAKDRHGFITVETLYRYVQRRVVRWVRDNRNRRVRTATQFSCEGDTRKMPLAICPVSRTASASSPRIE